MSCIFCEIVKGNIPCYKIYEDKDTLAFLDISKEGYGHTLVIPKKHTKCFAESSLKELGYCTKVAQKISNHYIKNCGFDGVNIIINNGESAGQSVQHLHVHIIPRKKGDNLGVWNIKEDQTDLKEVQKYLEVKA